MITTTNKAFLSLVWGKTKNSPLINLNETSLQQGRQRDVTSSDRTLQWQIKYVQVHIPGWRISTVYLMIVTTENKTITAGTPEL